MMVPVQESTKQEYFKLVHDKIQKACSLSPASLMGVERSEEGKLRIVMKTVQPVTVMFQLKKDGQVNDVRVEVSSGIAAVDNEAMSAVIRAGRFPHFPEDFKDESVTIHQRFIFRNGQDK